MGDASKSALPVAAPQPGAVTEAVAAPVVAARPAKHGPSPWPPRLAMTLAFLPGAWLLARGLRGRLGADPVDEVLNALGLYAICFLLGSLACTPLQKLSGWTWPVRVRKHLGLAAFFYALLHLSCYAFVDQGFAFSEILKDVLKRPFITLGMGAFLLLLPLALTSFKRAEKRLGFRRWKRLHRLAYLAGVLACIHFYLRFKLPERLPIAFGILLLILLGFRLGWDQWRASRTS
jgi:methionine sulfoxide reductase heme-binding subunit